MFRVGTTSYIIPDEILPNVEHLAGCFNGVLTLEVFNQEDLLSSLATLRRALAAHDLTWSKNCV